MQLSIGYQLPDEDDSLVEIAHDFREHVAEVYFAMPGEPSGRSPIAMDGAGVDAEACEAMQADLEALSRMGIRLVLLLNAACYGDDALSEALSQRVQATVGHLLEKFGLASVTTTSPFLARVVKKTFPNLEVRASVNLRIGTVKGMQYLARWFDGFTLQREYNRDLERIATLKTWCNEHGKRLYFLANSGCLRECSSQAFHDNLVAHEAGIRTRRNVPQRFPSPCWEFLAEKKNWVAFLQNTWVRPEDLWHYEAWFDVAKLATRMHANPRRVVSAYARGRFHGNLLDLMEPGYAPLFHGYILDNDRFPNDWFERTTTCDKACHRCDYCRCVLERVLVRVEDWE